MRIYYLPVVEKLNVQFPDFFGRAIVVPWSHIKVIFFFVSSAK